MTFFWNGNRSGYFKEDLETYVEIPSDTVPFNEAPEMKAREITEAGKEALLSGKYDMVRVNYANPGMTCLSSLCIRTHLWLGTLAAPTNSLYMQALRSAILQCFVTEHAIHSAMQTSGALGASAANGAAMLQCCHMVPQHQGPFIAELDFPALTASQLLHNLLPEEGGSDAASSMPSSKHTVCICRHGGPHRRSGGSRERVRAGGLVREGAAGHL